MIRTARLPHPGPINAINVTPFIDVLLVLIIMIVITIPTQTHKVPVNLPTIDPFNTLVPTVPHRLGIDRQGGLAWDGQPIADAQLPGLLAAVAADKDAELQMSTDPEARYERFDAVLAMVKRANISRLGFVGNRPLAD